MKINDNTIRHVSNCIGRAIFKKDCRKVDSLLQKQESEKLNFKNRKKVVLYIEADGAALNTRHKDADGSTWRENKLRVIYSSDNIYHWKNKKVENQHRIEKREYVSYIGSTYEFSRHLHRCAFENGYGSYQETLLLSDGATWIAGMAEELFPDAQHILDLYHLKENVHSFSKSKFGMNEEKYIP